MKTIFGHIDKKVILGIGIGIIIGVVFMIGYSRNKRTMSDYEIEERARELGMIYENEVKSVFEGEDKK